jgi:hypothetical protein
MPNAGNAVIRLPPCEVESETLYLPSDFPFSERDAYDLAFLGGEERKLREGEAFDSLLLIQTAVKTTVALRDRKHRHARGQAENTRSGILIRNAEAQRDLHMETYNVARSSMIALGFLGSEESLSSFPPLTLEDTFMKSQQRKRGLGDSHRTDGLLWHMGGVSKSSGPSLPTPTTNGESEVGKAAGVLYYIFLISAHLSSFTVSGTQMTTRQKKSMSSKLYIYQPCADLNARVNPSSP